MVTVIPTRRGSRARWAALVLLVVGALLVPVSADAKPGGFYPSWQLRAPSLPVSPAPVTYVGALDFGSRQVPNAVVTVHKPLYDFQDVSLLTGATGGDWLASATPVGRAFAPSGPSATIKYLSVAGNPKINQDVTITLRFARPAPAGQVAVVVGDIDVETVGITGRTKSGAAVDGSRLQGAVSDPPFNYCDVPSPKPPNCAQSGLAVPTWSAGPEGGTVSSPVSNGSTVDDTGAAVWIAPSVPVKSLTLTLRPTVDAGSGHSVLLWAVGREILDVSPIPPLVVPPGNGGNLPIVVPIRPPTGGGGRASLVVSARLGSRYVPLCATARAVSGGQVYEFRPRCRMVGDALAQCRRAGSLTLRAVVVYAPAVGAAVRRTRTVTVACSRSVAFTG